MKYSDSHTEFIHHPEDLAVLKNPDFLTSQINPQLINQAKPNLLFLAINVEPTKNSWFNLVWVLEEYLKIIKENSWTLVLSKKDLDKGGIKIILHVEDLAPIGNDLEKINYLYSAGVRSIGLTHNPINQFSGGCLTPGIGLTKLGREAIKIILKNNMILDFAHLSKKGFLDVIQNFKIKPFISHCGINSVYNNPRNVDDEILQLVKEKGGHVGIGFAGSFLAKEKAGINDVLDQINYAIKLAGADKVGIGSDFGGIISFLPEGLESISNINSLSSLKENILNNNLINFIKKVL